MSCLSLEEKRVSGKSERREMLFDWKGHGNFKEQPRMPCGPSTSEENAGNEVHFHKRSCSSH